MMKKLFSFIILLIFITIGFYHNSMSVFALGNNGKIEFSNIHKYHQNKLSQNINKSNSNSKKVCVNTCCLQGVIQHGLFTAVHKTQDDLLKTPICYNTVSLDFFSERWKIPKNLYLKNSYPYDTQNIKNYSYHSLIKIVKSII